MHAIRCVFTFEKKRSLCKIILGFIFTPFFSNQNLNPNPNPHGCIPCPRGHK